MLIDINSAPCGAGKTHAIQHHAKSMAERGEHVLLVQPTKLLLRQTAGGLRELGVGRVTAIFGEGDNLAEGTHERSVVARAMEHLRKPRDGGEVLLLTHAAHQRLPYVHRRHDWHLVFDEAPQAVWCHELNVPDTHRMLTDAISTEEFNPEYLRVGARDRGRLQAFAANRNVDDIYGLLSPVANVLLSRHWQAFVDAEQFNNALDAHGSKRKLSFHATLLPSLMEGYRSATVLAADAGETALVHLWAGSVRFREARHLDRHLRYISHPNGSLLTVEYISEEDWSKRHRDKRAEDGRPLLDHAVEAVRRRFGEAEFAWMGNLDLGDDLFGDAGATRLPNSSHGLNSFTHLHNAALLSALNPPPAHFAFLDSIGIGGDAVRTALYRQAIYQAACRTSLRDPTDATPKCIVVPDRATAAWLAEKFPGCQVGAIAGVPALAKGRQGRPRLHESPAMRDRQHREAERDRLLADVLALRKQELERQRGLAPPQAGLQAERQHGLAHRQAGLQAERQHGLAPAGAPPIPDSRCDENTIRGRDSVAAAEQAEAPPRVFATLYASLRDTDPAHHLACSDWREFVAALRLVWQDSISGKGATARFIPAHVDPAYSAAAAGAAAVVADETWSTSPGAGGGHDGAASPSRSRRGGDNVRSAHVLALDNDGGDLAKEEFARLVPWRMLIVNSYSSRPGAERWRALIPTDVPVTAELYRLFTGRLLKRLNRAGYWSKEQLADNPRIKSRLRHGFDTVKLGAASIFDLPSQAGAGPEASFFLDLTDGREAIDVDGLIRWLDLRRGDTAERLRELQDAQSAFDALAPEQQAAMQRSVRAAVWAEMSDEDRAAFPEFDPERAA